MLKLLLSLLCLTIPARGDLQGDSILEKARIEGIVNIAGNQMITNKLVLEAFKKKYPFIKVNVIDFEFINAKYRFYHLFESDSPSERGDVILRAEDKDLEEWIKNGWLAKLSEMPFWAQRPMSEERSPYYAYYVGMTHGLVYNPEMIKEKDLPKSYDDLISTKWRGKIVVRSPLKGVSGATLVSYINQTRGMEWFRKLGANRPYVVQDYIEQHRMVLKKKYPVALSRDLELASYAQQIKDHEGTVSNLKFALMKEEVPYQYMVAALNSKPLHPAAASLFLEFLLSKEAGKILEGSGYSAGQRRLEHLSRPKVWHWEMDSVSSMYEYQSYVARALRLLRDGGAKIEPVLRYGVPAFE